MRSIVVGFDESEAGTRALDRAAELAEALSASLVVVSVGVDVMPVAAAAMGSAVGPVFIPAPLPETVMTPEQREHGAPVASAISAEEMAERMLASARSRLAGRRLAIDYVAAGGDPAERLLELADERQAEMVVVGARDHGFFERLLARPVEDTVARRCKRDVLLVHCPD